MNQWSIATRNLARNKRRNLATGIAIALGFAALVALGGYANRVRNYLRVYTLYLARTGHVVVYKKDGFEKYSVRPRDFSLTPDDLKKIESVLARLDNIELHGPQLLGNGLIGNGCKTVPFMATGIDPAVERKLRDHQEIHRWLDRVSRPIKGDGIWNYPPDTGAVAIAAGLSRLLHKPNVHSDFPKGARPVIVEDCLGPRAKDLIAADANVQLAAGTWDGMLSALDGEIVAIYETGITETNNSAVLTDINHLRKLYDTGNATFYSIWVKSLFRLPETHRQIEEGFRQAGLNVDIYPWTDEDISPFYSGTIQFVYTMIGFISFVLATVIIFSIFNASTMTIIERSQEIGMMRSLGFTRRQIRQLYVKEMLVLAILSVLAGSVLAAVGILGVNNANIILNPPGVSGGMKLMLHPTPLIIAAAFMVIYVLSVTTTLIAIRSVSRQSIPMLLDGGRR